MAVLSLVNCPMWHCVAQEVVGSQDEVVELKGHRQLSVRKMGTPTPRGEMRHVGRPSEVRCPAVVSQMLWSQGHVVETRHALAEMSSSLQRGLRQQQCILCVRVVEKEWQQEMKWQKW